MVRAFRSRYWPAHPPRLAAPPAPPPPPKAPAPALVLPSRSEAEPGRVTVRRVLELTAAHFKTTVNELLSDRRFQHLVRQRWVAMFVAHKLTGRSLVFIAKKMGGRDHTTVLNGIRCMNALLDNGDIEMTAAVTTIVEKLQGGAQ
jgi:chromosomal replication initiation ATPase DnaA